MGVATGARHQARRGPLLAVAGHRPPLDPRRLQGARPRHRRRHGGLLPGDLRGRPHRLSPALPRLPPPRVRRGGRLREVRGAGLLGGRDVPQSVRLEGLTDFCWLCENPQKLVVPFEMRGYQGVYNLERRLCSVCAVNEASTIPVRDESYVMVSKPRDRLTLTGFRSPRSPATVDIDSISSQCEQSCS